MDLRRADLPRYTVPMITTEQRDPAADIQQEICERFEAPKAGTPAGAVFERGPEEDDMERARR